MNFGGMCRLHHGIQKQAQVQQPSKKKTTQKKQLAGLNLATWCTE
jgi:hypothetical protein